MSSLVLCHIQLVFLSPPFTLRKDRSNNASKTSRVFIPAQVIAARDDFRCEMYMPIPDEATTIAILEAKIGRNYRRRDFCGGVDKIRHQKQVPVFGRCGDVGKHRFAGMANPQEHSKAGMTQWSIVAKPTLDEVRRKRTRIFNGAAGTHFRHISPPCVGLADMFLLCTSHSNVISLTCFRANGRENAERYSREIY